MNYRHIYHAGNFADVVKHITLISLLNKLQAKDKPFAVLDAFAGIGIYNLRSEQAERTNESEGGIYLLDNNLTDDAPKLIKQYFEIVNGYNGAQSSSGAIEIEGIELDLRIQRKCVISEDNDSLFVDSRLRGNDIGGQSDNSSIYPGSPLIISSLLRDHDRLIACELHKEDYQTLKRNMKLYSNSSIHNIDAYQSIKAFWPPKEKRGLVLLDPAFEARDEFDKIISALTLLKERFASGMVMVWYPIKDKKNVDNFYKKQKTIGYKETLFIEFELLSADRAIGMNKCGIMICNPPFVKEEITKVMEYLVDTIYHSKAMCKIWMEESQ